jgi:hypothetical protein
MNEPQTCIYRNLSLVILELINETFNSSNDRMIMNNELEMTLTEAIMT